MSVKTNFNGIINTNNFVIDTNEKSIPISVRTEVDNFLDGTSHKIDGSIVSHVQKRESFTNTKLDFTNTGDYDYDEEELVVLGGKVEMLKTEIGIRASSYWDMNSPVNGSTVVDSIDTDNNALARTYSTNGTDYKLYLTKYLMEDNIVINSDKEEYLDMWLNIRGVYIGGYNHIFSIFTALPFGGISSGISLEIDPETRYLFVRLSNGTIIYKTTENVRAVTDGEWIHLAMHFKDNRDIDVYYNGIKWTNGITGSTYAYDTADPHDEPVIGPFNGYLKNLWFTSEDFDIDDLVGFRYANGRNRFLTGGIPTPQGRWSFDDGSGVTVTDSIVGDNFTLDLGSDKWEDGDKKLGTHSIDSKIGLFHGSLNFSLSYKREIRNPISIEFWIKYYNETGEQYIVHKEGDISNALNGPYKWGVSIYEGRIRFYDGLIADDQHATTYDKFNDNTWKHVVITGAGGPNAQIWDAKIYINNELVLAEYNGVERYYKDPIPAMTEVSELELGDDNTENAGLYQIDELLIYGLAMTADQVNARFNKEEGTVLYGIETTGSWKFISSLENSNHIDTDGSIYTDNTLDLGANSIIGITTYDHTLTNRTPFSIIAWINIRTLPSDERSYIFKSFNNNVGYYLRINPDGRPVLFVSESASRFKEIVYDFVFEVDTWYHIAWVNTTSYVYINDRVYPIKDLGSSLLSGEYSFDREDIQFGNFDGVIDEVVIYKKTLNGNEVGSRYNGGVRSGDLSGVDVLPSLIFYFDEVLQESSPLTESDEGIILNAIPVGSPELSSSDKIISNYSMKINNENYLASKVGSCPGFITDELSTSLKRFSVECWVKGAECTELWSIDDGSNYIRLYWYPSDIPPFITKGLHFRMTGPSLNYIVRVNDDTVPFDGSWHHIIVSYDGSGSAEGLTVFVDGSEEAVTIEGNTIGSSLFTWSEDTKFNFASGLGVDYTYFDGVGIYTGYNFDESNAIERYNSGSGTTDSVTHRQIAHYPLDSDLLDISGNVRTMVTTHRDTFVGESLALSAINSSIITGNNDLGSFNFDDSISFEIKVAMGDRTYGVIFQKLTDEGDHGYCLYIGFDNKLYFIMTAMKNGGGYLLVDASVTDFNDGNQHHMFITWDGVEVKMYVNNTTNIANAPLNDTLTKSIIVADKPFMVATNMTGIIGDVLVYHDKILDVSDITKRLAGSFDETYPLSVYKEIVSEDVIPVQVIYSITDIQMTETLDGQTIKYLFRVNYVNYKWNTSEWVLESNINSGNTKAELDAITTSEWQELIEIYFESEIRTFEVVSGLMTTDGTKTPSLSQITLVHNGYTKCTPSEIAVDIVDQAGTLSTLRNISGGDFDNIAIYAFQYE